MGYKEIPNVKVGVTNSVHSRLRKLKLKGDTFNDVIVRLLDEVQGSPNAALEFNKDFDIVHVMTEAFLDEIEGDSKE